MSQQLKMSISPLSSRKASDGPKIQHEQWLEIRFEKSTKSERHPANLEEPKSLSPSTLIRVVKEDRRLLESGT